MSRLFATCLLGLTLLGVAAPAIAQEAIPPLTSVVGDWLYDSTGEIVGSVYALAGGGQTAVLQLGSYLTPGRRLVSVPAADVVIEKGHATLRALTADDLQRLPSLG